MKDRISTICERVIGKYLDGTAIYWADRAKIYDKATDQIISAVIEEIEGMGNPIQLISASAYPSRGEREHIRKQTAISSAIELFRQDVIKRLGE